MCIAVNGQMELLSGTMPLFAVFFDGPLTFTENFQPGGINHHMRNFSPGGRFETDTDRFYSLADAVVIRPAKRTPIRIKMESMKPCTPQGKQEYALNHQNSGDGEVRTALGNPCDEGIANSCQV